MICEPFRPGTVRIEKDTCERKCLFYGGEEETRTPAPVSRPTPLAGAPRHQLEYFSKLLIIHRRHPQNGVAIWRREWDSNPRYVAVRRFSRPLRYDRFGTSPNFAHIYYHIPKNKSSFFGNFSDRGQPHLPANLSD